MMRLAISVTFLLWLLLLVATAQAIRLEGESLAAFRKELQEEDQNLSRVGNPVGGAVLHKKGQSNSGTQDKRRSTETVKAHHRLPRFHEDYYGPRNHNPNHH